MSLQTRARFYTQLAQTSDAGLPPDQALSLAATASGPPYSGWSTGLQTAMAQGHSLAEALAARGERPVITGLLAAGEASGRVPVICRRIAAIAEQQDRLRRQILARSAYPLLLLHVALILPPAVLSLIAGGSLAAGLVGPLLLWTAIGAGILAWRHPRLAAQRIWLLHGPLLRLTGPLRDAETCQIIAAGAAAGLLASEQLELAGRGCPWPQRARALAAQAQALRQGDCPDLASALAAAGLPADTVEPLRTAELAGSIDTACERLADEHFQRFHERSAWAARLLTALIYAIAMLVAALTILHTAASIMP